MYVKYQSNIEKHRNFITTHRVDDSYSALYAAHEDVFIRIAEGKNQGDMSETIYRMDKKEKVLLDNFLYVRNNGLLFNKCNVDVMVNLRLLIQILIVLFTLAMVLFHK